jgi:hypothetical protein
MEALRRTLPPGSDDRAHAEEAVKKALELFLPRVAPSEPPREEAQRRFREARVQAARLDEAARKAKEEGRLEEAERLVATAKVIRAQAAMRDAHGRDPKDRKDGHGPDGHDREALRRKIAELKERSEALERKGKALRAQGDEASGDEAMRQSGETWSHARELERRLEARADRRAHRRSDDLPDPRGGDEMRRAREESTFVERGARRGPPGPDGPRRFLVVEGRQRVDELREDVARLREDLRRMRALLEDLRQELRGRKASEK